MLTKKDKVQLRGTIFRHLDGIATATTTYALHKKGVLDYLLKNKTIQLSKIASHFNANNGYLNVALRVLSSQGWLVQNIDNKKNNVTYSTNKNSVKAFELAPLYKDAVNVLNYAVQFPEERHIGSDTFIVLERIFKKYNDHYGLKTTDKRSIEYQVLKHIEGCIVAPITVMLGINGLFHKYFMEASFSAEEYHNDPESFKKILDFLSYLGWFKKKNENYQFTEEGLFFAKRASAYGVTVSYLPTFLQLDELIFDNPLILKSANGETEKHLHREINVWGSGGAHSTYFKVIDQIIIELFNKPIDEQPKGILDMGCGNGAFIQHIFDVIEHQTLRGKMLEEYPMLLVGADFNKAALKVTRANLIKADIWAKVIWGDIGRPDLLAKDLLEDYNIELKDLLNVRTFLDHNRIWQAPKKPTNRVSISTGAFVSEGKRLSNNLVEDSLLEHLKKWKPYIEKFGLLIIELHTIDPELTAKNISKTAATAYDATHGYSDQYILEVDIFNDIVEQAGLETDVNRFSRFPDSDLATVSVNLLKGVIL